MSLSKIKNTDGFTLVEMAVVLVIVGILVGSFIGTITSRIETTRRDNTSRQLEDIRAAILGFAGAEGRLPCPTTADGLGVEQDQPFVFGVCISQHGFVPGRTLGINGIYNRDNLLLDAWKNPIRYSVTDSDLNAFTRPYSVPESPADPTGIKGLTMAGLNPDLVICDSDSNSNLDCTNPENRLIDNAPFIILSLGGDGADFVTNVAPDSDQGENSGEAVVAANAAGENIAYTVGDNIVFVSKNYSSAEATAGRFDDLILWVSPYVLYKHMMEAGQLP
ncbi:MAG: prepilin-type N-terminal cleavage/methylation domain-containing protein [Gammaproteobacteria bacterium]|nr:prepilin-type N-terminal cleavage/methylation domain-containing protein [Gammaproteobacteria bacterium]